MRVVAFSNKYLLFCCYEKLVFDCSTWEMVVWTMESTWGAVDVASQHYIYDDNSIMASSIVDVI